jgi:hypothetical protein
LLLKPEELEVGNWVIYIPEGNYCRIKSLKENYIILSGA